MSRCSVVVLALWIWAGPTDAELLINEVHFDPAGNIDLRGDANNDGAVHYKHDEFVEILNTGPATQNISGYYLGDNDRSIAQMFQFPPGTTILVNEMITLFGGGTPSGFGGQVFVDDGDIGSGLGNDNENLWLISADLSDTTEVYWGSAVRLTSGGTQVTSANSNPNEAYTRNPDGGGTWSRHSVADTDDNSLFSPGARISGEENLPVTLTSFTAQVVGERVHLAWHTESEQAFSHFEVLKASSDNLAGSVLMDVVPGAPGGHSTRPRDYTVDDDDVSAGEEYWYGLVAVDLDGTRESFGPVYARINESKDTPPASRRPRLTQNAPNPFNPRTTIGFVLEESGNAVLDVYDTTGRRLRGLASGFHSAGAHQVVWDGRDDRGVEVPSGSYLYRIATDAGAETRRMLLLK